ncbi:MAG: triacylglycerol lipase [Actinomycetota bacterium]|nr:triacylglycerol lipase [Actinomycetota bacterium]
MSIAVGIIAGTAIRGAAATVMMRGVLERHPNAFLITLANFGVTLPLHKSQAHIRDDIRKALRAQGRARDSPIVLVGHSQGALAVLRYTIDHQHQVKHVFSIGTPWHGAVSAGRVSRLAGHRLLPALRDMTPGSEFLTELHVDLPAIASRVTNIYSTHELFIRPYTDAHINVPGVTNVLIATESEHLKHLQMHPDLELDDIILGSVNHLSEMSSPDVRGHIWGKVEEIAAAQRWPGPTPPQGPADGG